MAAWRGLASGATRRRWLFVGAMLGALLVASVVRPPGAESAATGWLPPSAWFHAAGYAGVTLVLSYALRAARDDWRRLLGAFACATVVGAGIELVQMGLPYRTFSVGDVLVNAAGAALAVVGWRLGGPRSDPSER
ncbi:VanZ family protein [Haloplanus halobius]|uniref:VanZ family protein n=1 Tax=Haloplanus halobius TaxID=2934938 RepID=UPI00200FCB62|nr:VanZ family protein [Haloplanus sp. XH21]